MQNAQQTILQEEMETALMEAYVKGVFLLAEMFDQSTLVQARTKLVKRAKQNGFHTWKSEEIINSGEWLLFCLFKDAQSNEVVVFYEKAKLALLEYTLYSYEQVLLNRGVNQSYIGNLKQIFLFTD